MEEKPNKLVQSKVVSEQIMYEGKWLGMKKLNYMIGEKLVENYETMYRTTTKDKGGAVDGVDVVPIIKYQGKEKEIVLIANFRPPTNKFSLQFPAGLNEDKDYEENARRELKEEAGLIAKQFVKMPNPVICSDPWKSNQCGIMYLAIIDGDDPASRVQQQLDGQENIRVHSITLNEHTLQNVNKLAQDNNYGIEAKVWGMLVGLSLAKLIS